MWSRSSVVALLLLSSLGARAEDRSLERFHAAEPHMGTLFQITLYALSAASAQAAFEAAFQRIAELDAVLSDYDPQSELMRVCREAHLGPVRVSEDLFTVLEAGQKLAVQTDGAFDVTLGPVTRLWREARQERRRPDKTELRQARQRSGYRKLELNPDERTVFLKAAGMQLDVGGIGKGYAADEALKTLRSRSFTQALVGG
ncbi:MAG: FAD:protein FMN transferase, partial [Bryobacteraceae bacterium]